VDSAQFTSGLKSASSQATQFGRSIQQTTSQTRGFQMGLQNVGFQVQDVAVQIAGGTSAFTALAQQLPQLLSGFGLLGVGIGTVVGVGGALWKVFGGAGDAAKTTVDALKSLSEALTDAKSASDLLALSQGELAGKFGDVATGAAIVTARTRDEIEGMLGSIRDTGTSMLAPLQEVIDQLDAVRQTRDEALGLTAFQSAEVAVQALADAMKLPAEQATELRERIEAFRAAVTAQDMAAALLGIYQQLSAAKDEMGQLPPEAEALRINLGGAVDMLTSAVAQTNVLTGALSEATAEAGRLAHMRELARQEDARANVARDVARDRIGRLAETEDARTAAGRGVDLSYEDRRGLPSTDPRSPNYDPTKGAKKGGGAKLSEEAKQAARDLAEFQAKVTSVFEATRTPMEQYQAKIQELNKIVAVEGGISWDTYNRAVIQAQEELDKAGQTGSNAFRNMGDDFGDLVANVVQGTSSMKEGFASMLASIGGDLISSGIGGIFSNLFKGMKLPGFARGTPFAPGGLSLVGERGPELLNLPRGSRVTPNSALGGSNVINFAPVYNVAGADAAQIAQLRAENQANVARLEATFGAKVQRATADPRFRGRV
jgi:hypothetical protein